MSVCPIKTLPEWQKLEKTFGVSAAMSAFTLNKNEIPSLEEARNVLNTKPGVKEVFRSNNQESIDKLLNHFNSDVFGNIKDFSTREVQSYIKVNELPLTASKEGNKVVVLENNSKVIPSIEQHSTKEVHERIQNAKKILDNLSERFNIQYEFNSELNAKGAFNSKTNKVTINPEIFTKDTLFHEFAHPFILSLKQENNKLYQSLIAEAAKNANLIDAKKRLYPEATNEELLEEILVEMIGQSAANKLENKKQKNLIQRFIDWVNELLSSFNGVTHKITLNSTINDIGDFFANSSEKINLDNDYTGFVESENLLQASEDEIAEIERAIEEEGINDETVDKWYKDIQKYIKNSIKLAESRINTKKATIGAAKGSSKVARRLRNLKEIKDLINANQKVASIAHFVSEYSDEINRRYNEFYEYIDGKVKNIETMSQEELSSFLERIAFFNMFSQSNSVLKEIANDNYLNMFANKYKAETGNSSLVDKANDSIKKLNSINKQTLEISKKVLAYHTVKPLIEEAGYDATQLEKEIQPRIVEKERRIKAQRESITNASNRGANTTKAEAKLRRLIAEKNELEQLKAFQVFTPEAIINIMSFSSKDTSFMARHTLPMMSYKDPVAALFAKKLKEKLLEARDKTMDIEHRIGTMYNKLAKSYGKSLSSLSEFQDFIEEVEEPIYGYDQDGDMGIVGYNKVKQLISEIDQAKYNSAVRNMYAEADKKYGKVKSKERGAFIGEWFSKNTEAKSMEEITEIINHHKSLLAEEIYTQEEYDKWEKKNIYTNSMNQKFYMNELSRPKKSIYTSSKYKMLQLPQNKAKLEFYNEYKAIYDELQSKIPDGHRVGLKLPSVHKGFNAKIIEDGVMKAGKDLLADFGKYQAQDQEYGTSTVDGESVREIPVYFTQFMPAENVSNDIVRSLLLFSHMANEYDAKESMQEEIHLMEQVMMNRQYGKTNSLDRNIYDQDGDQQIKSSRDSKNITEEFLAMIDKNFYGVKKIKAEMMGIAVDKISDTMMGWQALSALGGFRPLKAIANNTQANLMVLTEAAAAKYIDTKSYALGKKYYWLKSKAMLKDMVNPVMTGKSLQTQLIEKFDVLKGEFVNELGRVETGSISKKIANQRLMFFTQKISEHEAQISAFFGMLHFNKVKNASGVEVPLIDAFELDSEGLLSIKKGYDFSEKDVRILRNKISALSDRLYGVYNDFDASSAQRLFWVRSVFMFRKFMPPGFARRFKSLSYDYQLGDTTEGMYRSYYNSIRDGVLQEGVKGLMRIVKNGASMTPLQKENSKRTRAEAMLMILFWAATSILESYMDDDDEFKRLSDDSIKKRAIYGLQYEFVRLGTELRTYAGPTDLMRVISTPSVNATYIERIMKLVHQMGSPTEVYQRRQGLWEKGDLKILAKLSALFGITGNEWNPKYATQNLKRFL